MSSRAAKRAARGLAARISSWNSLDVSGRAGTTKPGSMNRKKNPTKAMRKRKR